MVVGAEKLYLRDGFPFYSFLLHNFCINVLGNARIHLLSTHYRNEFNSRVKWALDLYEEKR